MRKAFAIGSYTRVEKRHPVWGGQIGRVVNRAFTRPNVTIEILPQRGPLVFWEHQLEPVTDVAEIAAAKLLQGI